VLITVLYILAYAYALNITIPQFQHFQITVLRELNKKERTLKLE